MGKRLLIVEDDELVRDSLFEVLSLNGYEVVCSENARSGFERLAEKQCDVALIDLRLPDMTGIDFLRKCRERYPSTDVLMMTSYGTIETAVEAIKLGAYDYLTKPIHDGEITLLLKRIFETRSLRDENLQLKEQLESDAN